MSDTIAAISTPFGEGAIAVLRLSGPGAVTLADDIFHGKTEPSTASPRVQHFGAIHDGAAKLDNVLLTVFRAPHSYTGEDIVEIACHGGVLIARRILELLLKCGARSAQPGEFTQRAYLHGKMDLTQAEAVMDLISAQTDLALRAASEQLAGGLGERIRALQETLLGTLAHIEAFIDFPDEDIDPDTGAALQGRLDTARTEIAALLATAAQGRILREGVRVVIYGAPNVGKSSLLNLLLGTERAIVSARPGTTRDVIEEVINLRGLPVRLVDTAGLRESDDELERAGMERTQRAIEYADIILHVVDANAADDQNGDPQKATGNRTTGNASPTILVLNKTDLGEHADWRGAAGSRISCLNGTGLEALADAIVAQITSGTATTRDWTLAINTRHAACLETARRYLDAASQALTDGLSAEFVAEELRTALQAVGDVIGRTDTEDLLGVIFSTFCIGK